MAEDKIEQLRKRRAKLMAGGGSARIEKQHSLGRLTARERIELLFEPDTFRESLLFVKHRCTQFGMSSKEFPGAGVLT
jgi:acetyl-CoA carboxylase carboxyltransferase component